MSAADPRLAAASSHPHVAAGGALSNGSGWGDDSGGKRQRTGDWGAGGAAGAGPPFRLLRLEDRVRQFATEADIWRRRQQNCTREQRTNNEKTLIKLTGLTCMDLEREAQLLGKFQEEVQQEKMGARELRKRDMDFVRALGELAGPWQRLFAAPKDPKKKVALLCMGNVTEVVEGFAYIGAGGKEAGDSVGPVGAGGCGEPWEAQQGVKLIGGLCCHSNTSEGRREQLRDFYKKHNIRYILNLAGKEPQMQGASYPVDNLEVVSEPEGGGADVFDIADDPSDDKVRVLKLPMVDNDDEESGEVLDVKNSKELGEASRFLERAWRRHKRELFDQVQRRLAGKGLDPEPTLPAIFVHCVGGINRSPLCVIHWIQTYHSNTSIVSKDAVWHRTVLKRQSFTNVQCVLHKKKGWMEAMWRRYEAEKAGWKQANLPSMGFGQTFQQYRKHVSHQSGLYTEDPQVPPGGGGGLNLLVADCGGLVGAPALSDDEDQGQ